MSEGKKRYITKERILRAKRLRELWLAKRGSVRCLQQVEEDVQVAVCSANTACMLSGASASLLEFDVDVSSDEHCRDVASSSPALLGQLDQPQISESGTAEFGEHDLDELPPDSEHRDGMRSQLMVWAVKYHIRRAAVDSLLKLLRPHFSELPKTCQALVFTPRDIPILQLSNGQDVHFGLRSGLLRALNIWHSVRIGGLSISINVDGLPLFKSSNTQAWPILVQVHHPHNKRFDVIFPIGIFCGTSKPACLEEYLKLFIEGLGPVLACGICHKRKVYKLTVRAIPCYAPAKAYVKATKLFSGYYGRDKCCAKGVYLGRITYQSMHSPLHTDESFVSQTQKEHHKGVSPLVSLGIPMVTAFPCDYMHMVCLGVVRKIIGYWLKGPLTVRLANFSVRQISGLLATF